jgi:hypothetical protein
VIARAAVQATSTAPRSALRVRGSLADAA